MAESTSPLRVVEETPAHWRVVFNYPPFNVLDGTMFQSLQDLLARMDASQTLRVVVFESAIPDFYLAHFDLTGKLGNVMSGVGPTSLPVLLDTFVRITKSPVVRIAREHAAWPTGSCSGPASGRRRRRTPPPPRRPRPRLRNRSRRL